MAASWRGAWRSRERGVVVGGGGDPVQPVRHATSLVDQYVQYGFNYCSNNSTTASGTTLSNTTYTASSTSASYPAAGDGGGGGPAAAAAAGSALSSALPPADAEEEVGGVVSEQEKAKTREHIRDLLLLVHGSPESPGAAAHAATGHAPGYAAIASSSSIGAQLDRWLTELRVGWVLHLAGLDDASARRAFVSRRLQYTAQSWTLALRAISRCVVSFTGWCSSSSQEQEGEEEEGDDWWPPASEFVGFVAAALLQMLAFVDAVVAVDIVIDPSNDDDDDGHQRGGGAVASAHKFQTLADVRDALSGASEQVQLWHLWLRRSPSSPDAAEATTIAAELSNLLSAKLGKMDEAIRSTRDHIRTQFMSLMHEHDDDHRGSWATSPSGLKNNPSPGVHKATRSVVSYIIVLSISSRYTRSSADPAPAAVYGDEASPRGGGGENNNNSSNTSSCTNMIMVMIRSLEGKLARVSSQSFADQSLRLLFLINNLYFVWHQLRTNSLVDVPTYALTPKIDGYINSYLQVSWTPVVEPLLDSSRHCCCCCFMGRYSAEHRFEMKFDETYTKQKLWKVPDPELREELRAAITKKVISAFTKFLGGRNGSMSASRVATLENLEEMLEELFEG